MDYTEEMVRKQHAFFAGGTTKPVAYRKKQLVKLYRAIAAHEEEIFAALKKDLNKSAFEAYETEVGIVRAEITYMLRHLDTLARPRRRPTPLTLFPGRSYVISEPYGVALIISPWNYPFQLTLVPLIGAIAAGNCAIVKPSNHSPHTSDVIRRLLAGIYSEEYVGVVLGGREANKDLLAQHFDYIFFTGSVHVGKTVMESAARHLTPLTLELGGKSPCIVDETADIRLAAKRIIWGKLINAGQTCVAPDYVLVQESRKEALIKAMRQAIRHFYGDDICTNPDYPKIISKKHFDRLRALYSSERHIGGAIDEERLVIEPVLLPDASFGSAAMKEEIFGPILPVIAYEDLSLALSEIRRRPKPLALYLFTTETAVRKKVLREVSFGGGCINDTLMHFANGHLPFGGVGLSGMGSYHEAASFATFSHRKSIVDRALFPDVPVRYPPAGSKKLALLKKILK